MIDLDGVILDDLWVFNFGRRWWIGLISRKCRIFLGLRVVWDMKYVIFEHKQNGRNPYFSRFYRNDCRSDFGEKTTRKFDFESLCRCGTDTLVCCQVDLLYNVKYPPDNIIEFHYHYEWQLVFSSFLQVKKFQYYHKDIIS